MFILALERSHIPSVPSFTPPRTKGPQGPLQQRIWPLALSSRDLIIDVLFSLRFCPLSALNLSRCHLLQRRFELLCFNRPRSTLGMSFLRHIRHIGPKYRILDRRIYVDLIGHPSLCPGNPLLFVYVFLNQSTYPRHPFKYAHPPFNSRPHCHQCSSISYPTHC